DWAVEVASGIDAPLFTCDAVLAEAAFHLCDAALVLAMLREGMIRSDFILSDHLPRLAEIATRYAERKPGLADLCLIRLSELNPRLPVITIDLKDFRVYRRGRREVIPLIHPPRRRSHK